MMKSRHVHGLTMVELMITLAVVAVLATLAAPSLYDFILVQRLKSINAQLVTDMQFARSEALSRTERQGGDPYKNVDVQVVFSPAVAGAAMSCYSIYTDSSGSPQDMCDCTKPAGQRCPQPTSTEIRTVQIPTSLGVKLSPPDYHPGATFLSTTGAIQAWNLDGVNELSVEASINAARRLRTTIGPSGRPTVCSPDGGVSGFTPCPP